MKNAITFAVLLSTLSLVSCNSESSSKKTCTLNDQAVDCSTMNPQVSGKSFMLTAKVKADIAFNDGEIEILENTQNVENETKDGKDYECAAFTYAGDKFKTKVKNKTLQIIKDNKSSSYKLLSDSSNGIEGSWGNVEKDSMGSTTTTLNITEDTMEIVVNCQFN